MTEWMSPEQVCEYIPGMTIRRLQRMRDEGRGPAYSKAGRTIVYDRAVVDAWLRSMSIRTKESGR